ncbi:MAG: ABC transporter permease [Xanthomonadales bacterium]|nr:ABC transporter permease [Xanthomonadales bacterium]
MWQLAWRSLWNRRASALLTLLTIAASVALLLAVERVRVQARASFASTVSGTDLIVGARGGSIQLLLYAIFGIGDAPQNFSWDSYEALREHPDVAWTIPLALGDSYRGQRVLATDHSYFEHYRYGGGQSLQLSQGHLLESAQDAVLGAEVARLLDHGIGDSLVLSHGLGEVSFSDHKDAPFRVVGILAPTGTPVDRTVHIDLAGLQHMHRDWQHGVHIPGSGAHQDHAEEPALTAALLGLKSRTAALQLREQINRYAAEPLTAILPGFTLQQLWSLLGVAEQALRIVALLVVLAGLLGMTATLVTSLGERRREMAVLRAVGAAPRHIFGLLLAEALCLALLASVSALALFTAAVWLVAPYAQAQFGLLLPVSWPTPAEWGLLALVILAAGAAGLVPAVAAYRRSLADGLSLRL